MRVRISDLGLRDIPHPSFKGECELSEHMLRTVSCSYRDELEDRSSFSEVVFVVNFFFYFLSMNIFLGRYTIIDKLLVNNR